MRNAGPLRKFIGVVFAAGLFALNATPQAQSLRAMPSEIRIAQGQQQVLDFFLPLKVSVAGDSAQVIVEMDQVTRLADVGASSVTILPRGEGSTTLTLSLFGLIPVKTVSVNVYPDKVLVPGGQSVGVTLRTSGVLIVGLADVVDAAGMARSPARGAGMEAGDELVSINGTPLKNIEQLSASLSPGTPITLGYTRGDQADSVTITPAVDAGGAPRIGAWVRDSTAGVGTLSYYDPASRCIGALGHAITDGDTGTVLSVGEGSFYYSNIVDIVKGSRGAPGELRGMFSSESQSLASLYSNSIFGVYGKAEQPPSRGLYPDGLPIALQSQVHTGPASVLTTLDDSGVQEYSARILSLQQQPEQAQRSMVIEITDQRLLSRTGGIVQGMSGSPIIQDGRIVGAVTHVYVNDPTRGYGIYIEWMLKQQEHDDFS